MTEHDLMIADAISKVMSVYAEQEIGYVCELNYERLSHYLTAVTVQLDFAQAKTVEDCMGIFTEDILKGEPVWRLLQIPEWTSVMLEREFAELLKQRELELKHKYKCLTCSYYSNVETVVGSISKCSLQEVKKSTGFARERRNTFQLKTRCKNYVQN